MDLTYCTSALARTQQWIALSRLTSPTKPAPAARRFALFFLLVHKGGHVRELFKVFILAVRVDRVRTMAFLGLLVGLSVDLLQFLASLRIADLFYGKLDSANFEDISHVYLIVLSSHTNTIRYKLFKQARISVLTTFSF